MNHPLTKFNTNDSNVTLTASESNNVCNKYGHVALFYSNYCHCVSVCHDVVSVTVNLRKCQIY